MVGGLAQDYRSWLCFVGLVPPAVLDYLQVKMEKMAKPCCVVVPSAAALGGDGDAHCSAACSERCLIQTTVPVALPLLTVH